jgi:2-desacetyl-2-hydroxyethyl bacteriochlorophyllide A dehydrogenase
MGYRGVLGHEFVGEVIDADDRSWVGRRVVADINAGCGECSECRLRLGHHCARRSVLGIVGRDGAMAERLTTPLHCLVAVPNSVSDAQAVFAEPLAAALHVLDDIAETIAPVVVVGDGKLGLLIALCLRAVNRHTIVIGHHREKLAIAANAGADVLLESELTPSFSRVPVVVEATGSASGLSRALHLLQPRGTLILKTTVAGPTNVDLSPIVIHELRVIGSRCGDLSHAVALLADRRIDPTPLIAERYLLAQADVAIARAAQRGSLKVLIDG